MLLFYNVADEVKAYQMNLTEQDAYIQRTTVEQIKKDTEEGKLKYVTASRTIDRMVEDVVNTAQKFKKVETL